MDLSFELSPELLVAFATLFVLEIVLGIDNVIFISILAGRLPPHQQNRARILGLALALISRIALLFAASWIITLTTDLFTIGELGFSGRDLILLVGGLFLVYKAVTEIHHKLEGAGEQAEPSTGTATFGATLVQIVALDVVFSFDAVITAVGMVDSLLVIITAVVLSFVLMMFLSGRIFRFVEKHPSVKMLALTFLLLIGVFLIADGFGVYVDKALIYGPMAFAALVEALNLAFRARVAKRSGKGAEPVKLRDRPIP